MGLRLFFEEQVRFNEFLIVVMMRLYKAFTSSPLWKFPFASSTQGQTFVLYVKENIENSDM